MRWGEGRRGRVGGRRGRGGTGRGLRDGAVGRGRWGDGGMVDIDMWCRGDGASGHPPSSLHPPGGRFTNCRIVVT